MLADELAADCYLQIGYPSFPAVQKKIAAAQKFNLAPDFALAADGLVENFTELSHSPTGMTTEI